MTPNEQIEAIKRAISAELKNATPKELLLIQAAVRGIRGM